MIDCPLTPRVILFAALDSVIAPPPVTVLNTVSRVMSLMRMKPGLSAASVTLPAAEKAPVKSMLPSEPLAVVRLTVPADAKFCDPVMLPAMLKVAAVPALIAPSWVLPVPLIASDPDTPVVADRRPVNLLPVLVAYLD